MKTNFTYDAGMLIAADRGDRRAWIMHRRAMAREVRITVPAGALGQAWRGGPQPLLSRMLAGCTVRSFDEAVARSAGAVCGVARTSDVIDASVVIEALRRDDTVITSDGADLRRLADAIGQPIDLVEI